MAGILWGYLTDTDIDSHTDDDSSADLHADPVGYTYEWFFNDTLTNGQCHKRAVTRSRREE